MDGHESGTPRGSDATSVDASLVDESYDDAADVARRSTDGAGDDGDGGDLGGSSEDSEFLSTVAKVFSGVIVALCCIYVFWVVHPELVFRNTTPTGGDMGAHVWGPAYLRDELLPNLRLTGWTKDWYAGFPAYTFYMVIPSLMIVILDVGFVTPNSFLGVVAALLVVGLAVYAAWRMRTHPSRLVRFGAWFACLFVPLLVIDLPYNIAFKLIAVSGIVAFPAGVWYLLRGLSLRRPGPELGAIASVAFLMDKSLFHIYGGNIASTMAGEFAFSISLTLSMFALGSIAVGLRTGRHRARSACSSRSRCCVTSSRACSSCWSERCSWSPCARGSSSLKWALPVGLSGGLMALWWTCRSTAAARSSTTWGGEAGRRAASAELGAHQGRRRPARARQHCRRRHELRCQGHRRQLVADVAEPPAVRSARDQRGQVR